MSISCQTTSLLPSWLVPVVSTNASYARGFPSPKPLLGLPVIGSDPTGTCRRYYQFVPPEIVRLTEVRLQGTQLISEAAVLVCHHQIVLVSLYLYSW